jgi:hypothetical protein
MTRRHVAAERRRATALPGTGRASGIAGLSLDQLVTLWRLRRGGLTVQESVALLGVSVHGSTARSAAEQFDGLITSPLPIHGTVRCGGCGARLTEIPCVACAGCGRRESYRLPLPK